MKCIIVVFCDLKHGKSPCFKSQNTTMIHLILTNNKSGFMKTLVLRTSISDHIKMIFSFFSGINSCHDGTPEKSKFQAISGSKTSFGRC